jgi:hypothetical protein
MTCISVPRSPGAGVNVTEPAFVHVGAIDGSPGNEMPWLVGDQLRVPLHDHAARTDRDPSASVFRPAP